MKLSINGEEKEVRSPDDTPLLWVLRDELKISGTKFGCGIGQCGACTVHLNGQPVRSCSLPVGGLAGAKITTIEGLNGPVADALRSAWAKHDVPQCGYCQSGQIMSAEALLRQNPGANRQDVEEAMKGNVCRCATYVRIRNAILDASEEIKD